MAMAWLAPRRAAAGAALARRLSLNVAARAPARVARPPPRPVSKLSQPLREVEVCREWTPHSTRCGLLGMKCGMTQTWTSWGEHIPLTVVEIQDLQVVQVKTMEYEGYDALQLGGGWQKRKRLARTEIGHFMSRNLPFKRYLREFPVTRDALLPVGTSITVRHLVPGQFVDVQGVTKGKGFAGAMKRWGFAGQPASHGNTKTHRKPGSAGGSAGSMYKTGVWKGKKSPGRMGGENRTVYSMLVYQIDPEHNLVYLKGSVPGAKGSVVRIKDAGRGYKVFMGKRGLQTKPPFPTFLPGDPDYEAYIVPASEKDPLASIASP